MEEFEIIPRTFKDPTKLYPQWGQRTGVRLQQNNSGSTYLVQYYIFDETIPDVLGGSAAAAQLSRMSNPGEG